MPMPTVTDVRRQASTAVRRREVAQAVRLRLYGVVFLVVIGLLLSLTVAVYRGAFTRSVGITLEADTLGNQMQRRADVKMRGLIVGEVREVRADGKKATLDIALRPEHRRHIPSDVHARLLPKTLFGEKYVQLVVPGEDAAPPEQAERTAPSSESEGAGTPGQTGRAEPAQRPAPRPIADGDVITQDRTRVGMELQQLMNDLLPLLRTVQPGELNATLSAFSTALEGRGDKIGANLTRLEGYLRKLNPHMPAIQRNISRFADTAEIYAEAAPDLLRVLRNTVTTSRTLVEQEHTLSSFLTGTATAADTTERFLDDNGDRLITLGRVSRPTLALLDRYSPQYPCLLEGLVDQSRRSEEAFRGGKMHITLEFVRPRPGYRPGEEPRYEDRSGPNCRGLPDPPVPSPGGELADGAEERSPSRTPAGGPGAVSGTEKEQRMVGPLVAPVMGVPADEVPSVATLLFGPMARGTEVSVA